MNVHATGLPEILLLEPAVFADDRGFFTEIYNRQTFARAVGSDPTFVQDNLSCSAYGVLRGLHYQVRRTQGKLIRVVHGTVYSVGVDIRRSSPRYGRWTGVELSSETRRQLWMPPGFAHGFLVLSEQAEVLYKTTDFYDPESERCLLWNDPDLGIHWPAIRHGTAPRLSGKDAAGRRLRDAETLP